MDNFIAQYEKQIIGHLSGFDRLVLRGTLRALAVKSGMLNYLWNVKVRLKDCGQFFLDKSTQLKEASCAQARKEGRSLSRKLSQFFINFTLSISKEYVSWLTLFLESLSTFYPFDNSLAPPSSESIR
jgi:hypothetical protein